MANGNKLIYKYVIIVYIYTRDYQSNYFKIQQYINKSVQPYYTRIILYSIQYLFVIYYILKILTHTYFTSVKQFYKYKNTFKYLKII